MIYLKIIITEKPREAKRISLSREPDQLTFNELCVLVQRLFPNRVKGQTEFKLTFLDEDQESINIESDQDVVHALELHSKFQSLIPSLKIQVGISNMPLEEVKIEKGLELKPPYEIYEKELNSINQKMSTLFDKVTVIETHLTNILRMIKSSAIESNSTDPNYSTAQILKSTSPLSVESPSGSEKLYSSASAPDSHNVSQFQSYNQPQTYQIQQSFSHSTSSPAGHLYGNTGGYASVIQVNQSPSTQYFSSSQPVQPSLNSNGISPPYNSHQVQQNQVLPPPMRFR